MAPGSLPFQCDTCSKRFAKMDHLNRHQLSHDATRDYQCRFCPAEFHRRDALLRHWKTCEQRLRSGLPEPVLPVKRAGRKLNACSRCAQLKKKCNGLVPCGKCLKKGQECTYPRSTNTTDQRTIDAPASPHEQQKNKTEFYKSEADGGVPGFFDGFQDSLQDDVQSLLSLCSLPPSALAPLDPLTEAAPFYTESYASTFPSILQSSPSGHHANTFPMAEGVWNPSRVIPLLPSLTPSPIFQTSNLRFLANFTSTHGIADSFECGDAISRNKAWYSADRDGEVVLSKRTTPHGESVARAAVSSPNTEEWEPPLSPTSYLLLDLNYPDVPKNEASMAESRDTSLGSKARDIVHGIQSTIHEGAKGGSTSADWTESREGDCERFFSDVNLDRFINAFFALWHPNWPIFHTPTFSAARKSPRLLAAMCLIGASLSPEKADRDEAVKWLDAVEEWVFSNPDFCEDAIPQADSGQQLEDIESRLDALRSAYAVVLMLSWEGSESQMTRSRRTRFSQVICVSRSLFSFASDRGNTVSEQDQGDVDGAWRLFALREECTRLLSYVFLLDCAFVIFNHMAPRMVISELQFNLACPDACFEAPDTTTWMTRMREWEADCLYARMTLSEAVNVLMRDEADTMDLWVLRNTGLLNLFALTSALHNMIFHHNNGPDYKNGSVSIKRAIRNWIRIWGGHEAASADLVHQSPAPQAPTGFIKYAREYWSLAVIVYERCEYTYRSRTSEEHGNEGGGYLKKFDTSDMGQIHELIVQFQNVDLSMALM